MSHKRAIVVTACTTAVLGISVAGAANPVSTGRAAASLATFGNPGVGVRFRYPAAWHRLTANAQSRTSALIVYLSNERLHTTCTRMQYETFCALPIKRLASRSILVFVTANGFAGWSLADAPGKPVKINGRQAKLAVTHARCAVSGELEMDLVIPGMPGNWYEFYACIRGPRTDMLRAQFASLLRTIEILD